MKRDIKAHKGGRTEHLHVRCTPDTKRGLDAMAKRLDTSVADLIEKLYQDAIKKPP